MSADDRLTDPATERVADLLRQVMRQLRRAKPEDWLALDLTMAQVKTLFVLHHQGASTMTNLAETLRITTPSLTDTLARVVRAGLVERRADPGDRRLVIVSLTAEGQALIERLQQGRRALLLAGLAQLDAEAIAALDYGLSALVPALATVEPDAPGLRPPADETRATRLVSSGGRLSP